MDLVEQPKQLACIDPLDYPPQATDPRIINAEDCKDEKSLESTRQGPVASPTQKPVRIVFAGSVDAGKSTLTGLLVLNQLDDGKGILRNKTTSIPHEKISGRTSSVGCKTAYSDDKTKILEMYDLCGHEKYLKTTISGITGSFADYGVVVIESSSGTINKMTEEHIQIFYYLNIPFIIILTKIDLCPKGKYKETKKNIKDLLERKFAPKRPLFIEKTDGIDVEKLLSNMSVESPLVNVISISCVTGINIDFLKKFMFMLSPRYNQFVEKQRDYSLFIIDRKYVIKGIGLVLSGSNFSQSISVGQTLYLGPPRVEDHPKGPNDNKEWAEFKIKSLHDNYKNSVEILQPNELGCIACKFKIKLLRSDIKNGMVIVSDYKKAMSNVTDTFLAKIKIFRNSSTTITTGFQSSISCNNVKQTAVMMFPKESVQKYLRSEEEAIIAFKLMKRPCYLEEECTLFFSEGLTKGMGTIVKLKLDENDAFIDVKPTREERKALKSKLEYL
jgi:elongation factor 1-alpha